MWPALLLPLACTPAPVDAAGAPMVLVSLDTLRADRLGAYGNPDGLTPNLDRFAAEGIVFERAYAQATTTAPSHASLFTSRYASEEDVHDRRPALDGKPTLADVLGAYGWETAAFVAGGDLSEEMGIGRGFGTWEDVEDFGSLWHTVPRALAWLDARAEGAAPWLLFVHGYDAHAPYLKPTPFGYARADLAHRGTGQQAVTDSTQRLLDGWLHPDLRAYTAVLSDEVRPRSAPARARLLAEARAGGGPVPKPATDEDIAHVRAVYDGGVAYADAQFGLLMAGLADRGVLDRATVVVFSDHGEQLGEDGLFNHCCGVGDEEAHVVLMARLPGGRDGGRRVSGLVELVDVMPTLVELAGATLPAGARGRSLVPALRGEPFEGRPVAFSEGGTAMRMVGVRSEAGLLLYEGIPASNPLAIEVASTLALPGPGFSAVGLDAPGQARLRDALVSWMRTLERPRGSAPAEPLPAALREELREHGYFEATP